MGRDWAENERTKPLEERHEILKWYAATVKFQRNQKPAADGLCLSKPTGAFAGFLSLAYDLYLIRHHEELRSFVIERIKKQEQFQGARYELYATSTCIRAGFEIQFEDEQDRSRKHVEFIASHKDSGLKLSIEAKSKHRKGILGQKGEIVPNERIKPKVVTLINQALKKDTQYPLVLFVDLNLPIEIAEAMFREHPPKQIVELMERVSTLPNGNDAFNLIVFTNNPHHYAKEEEPDPQKHYLLVNSHKPDKKVLNLQVLGNIERAVSQYGKIPNDFSEKDRMVF